MANVDTYAFAIPNKVKRGGEFTLVKLFNPNPPKILGQVGGEGDPLDFGNYEEIYTQRFTVPVDAPLGTHTIKYKAYYANQQYYGYVDVEVVDNVETYQIVGEVTLS
jgi:hypothetical protein